MTDPRNIAHDKKVQQEKKHHGEEPVAGAHHAVQPGKKPHIDVAPETEAQVEGQSSGDGETGEPGEKSSAT